MFVTPLERARKSCEKAEAPSLQEALAKMLRTERGASKLDVVQVEREIRSLFFRNVLESIHEEPARGNWGLGFGVWGLGFRV